MARRFVINSRRGVEKAILDVVQKLQSRTVPHGRTKSVGYNQGIKTLIPYDTGNLSQNALTVYRINRNLYCVYVDESIAPYMHNTNERWMSIKKNPNEGWWQRFALYYVKELARRCGGDLFDGMGTGVRIKMNRKDNSSVVLDR